jgi:hypothetical protein
VRDMSIASSKRRLNWQRRVLELHVSQEHREARDAVKASFRRTKAEFAADRLTKEAWFANNRPDRPSAADLPTLFLPYIVTRERCVPPRAGRPFKPLATDWWTHFLSSDGVLAFTDSRHIIRVHLHEDEVMAAALELAAARWGVVQVCGNAEHLASSARIAATMGIELVDWQGTSLKVPVVPDRGRVPTRPVATELHDVHEESWATPATPVTQVAKIPLPTQAHALDVASEPVRVESVSYPDANSSAAAEQPESHGRALKLERILAWLDSNIQDKSLVEMYIQAETGLRKVRYNDPGINILIGSQMDDPVAVQRINRILAEEWGSRCKAVELERSISASGVNGPPLNQARPEPDLYANLTREDIDAIRSRGSPGRGR